MFIVFTTQQKHFSAKNVKLLSRIIGLALRNNWLGFGEILKRIMGRFWGIIGASLLIDPLPLWVWQSNSRVMTHLYFLHVGQKSLLIPLQLEMSYEYFSSLDYPTQEKYLKKLRVDRETLPDPYAIAEDLWRDDVSSWPNFEFGSDSTGQFTKEKLRAFKLLEAYIYFSKVTCRRYSTTRVNPESLHKTYDTPGYSRTVFWLWHDPRSVATLHVRMSGSIFRALVWFRPQQDLASLNHVY